MEMNNKSEKYINDIVGSEALYHPTLKERVLGSKVAKTMPCLGVAVVIYSTAFAMYASANEEPPTPPFPGQETKEPKGKHKGWDNSQGNHYNKGFENSQGNHYHKGWE